MNNINRDRVLYGMCNDLRQQQHIAFKTHAGFAIYSPETPVWIRLARGTTDSETRAFFMDFCQNNQQLVGIVAENNIAEICARAYNRSFTQQEITAYYLPPETVLQETNTRGELRTVSAAEMPLITEWLQAFYTETLHTASPQLTANKKAEDNLYPPPRLYFWSDAQPVSMGMFIGSGETCRLNLIYTAPAFRNKGYGKALVLSLARKAREAGQIPMLYTASDNTASNHLYRSCGFTEAGRLTEVRFT